MQMIPPDIAFLGSDLPTWAGLLALLALSAGVLCTWWIALSTIAADRVWIMCGALAGATAQIIGLELLLGWLGILHPVPLASLEILFSAGLLWSSGALPPSRRWLAPFQWKDSLRSLHIPLWAWSLILLLAAVAARDLFWGWFLPPYHRDDIAYHLPIVATIVQNGAIGFWDSPSVWVRSYPINSELWQTWFCLFTGNDKLAETAFLFPVLLGGMALYGVSRALGSSRRGGLLAAGLFWFTPVTILQAGNSYNDAWLAALFFCGVCLSLRAARMPAGSPARRVSGWLVFSLAGILAGTKYLGLLWGAILLAVAGIAFWLDARERGNRIQPTRSLIARMALGASLAVFFAAYPYARNWIRAGNPLTPAEVRIGDTVLFPGRPTSAFLAIGSESIVESGPWQTWIVPLWMDRMETLFDPNNAGVGPFWFALGLIVLPAAFFAGGPRKGQARAVAALALLGTLVTPTNWRPRYDLPLLLAGGIGLAALHDASGRWRRMLLTTLAVASSAYAVWALSIPLPVKPAQAADLVRMRTDLDRNAARLADANEVYLWVDAYTRGQPKTILYGEHLDFYPLFGADFRNRLVHATPGGAAAWAGIAQAESVELIVVTAGGEEEDWTLLLPGFTLKFERDGLVIYAR